MFAFSEGAFKHALGIALEARLLDKVEETLSRSNDLHSIHSPSLFTFPLRYSQT
jgi:hypothetical protein